jgi:hypothetical protein
MNANELKAIISDQREELENTRRREGIIQRESYNHWQKWMDDGQIKVVAGIRRCGKSVFSTQLLKDCEFAYLNFDDERLMHLKPDEFNNIIEAFHQVYGDFKCIFFDEIQNIDNWELFVNRLKRSGFNLVITGSNGRLLSKELGTHLTGRYVLIGLFPFSFREYLVFEGFAIDEKSNYSTKEKASLMNKLAEYIENGGFPEMLGDKSRMRTYLQTLYSTILTKDVVSRNHIKYNKTVREMANYLISNFAQPASYNKIKNLFDLKSVHTAKNYMSYLEDAYLIFVVEKYSPKHKEVLASAKKVYCVDTGLANSIGFKTGERTGPLLENIVAIELYRRKALNPLMEIYYWKDYQQHEVDFVIKEGAGIRQLVQVTYVSGAKELKKSETDALLKASKDLKCTKLSIITWDYEDSLEIDRKRIKIIPVWKWLLSKMDD